MERKLDILGSVPSGLINSKLFHDLFENISDDELGSSNTEDKLFVRLCTSGSLLAIVTSSCGAQFSSVEDVKQNEEIMIFKNSFQGYLDGPKDTLMGTKLKIRATALAVIPILFSRGDKTHRASVVLVGFSNGHLYGYSMSGQTVFMKQIHEDVINQVTFMSPPFSRRYESLTTMAILCGSIVCIIEGWSLVQLIQSNVDKMNKGLGWSEYDEDMPRLMFKKWNLKDHTLVNDIAFLGHSTSSIYDYFCEASKVTGFESAIRALPSAEAKIISVGQQPMVALYKLNKDAGQVNMSKVVQAVASKTLNAVMGRISKASGWLGWGGQQKDEEQQQSSKKKQDDTLHESSDLLMDCNLPDGRRTVVAVSVSPLGDLLALVDAFGRVMLLECQTFTVRRMWKGYRDAQVGWRVGKEDFSSSAGERGGQLTQFLCIYAARRGILEVWPAQCGKRLTAYYIGKGCQLMYSCCDTFSVNEVTVSASEISSREKPKFRFFTVVLTPQGDLLSFSIPQGTFSEEDPRSVDSKTLKTFNAACESGDSQSLLEGISKFKLTSSLKHAIDNLLKQNPSLPFDFLLNIIGIAIKQLQPSNKAHEPLCHYLRISQHVTRLMLTLESLQQEDKRISTNLPFDVLLQTVFDIPGATCTDIASMLNKYYGMFEITNVMQNLNVFDVLQCFKLPSDIGNHLVNKSSKEESSKPSFSEEFLLQLKEGAEGQFARLGCKLFLPLLSSKVDLKKMVALLQTFSMRKTDLMNLLSHFFLSGLYTTTELTQLHQVLLDITAAVLKINDTRSEDCWTPVCRQCAITCNVGHAFSIILVHRKLTVSSPEVAVAGIEREAEDWESVSHEKTHWAILYTNVEVLVHLTNVVGPSSLNYLPSIPIYDHLEDHANEDAIAADLVDLKFQLFDKIYEEGNMSAAALKNGGLSLVTQCLCEWVLKEKIKPGMMFSISERNRKDYPGVCPLLKSLPLSLGLPQLLIHSTWQACYIQEDYYIGLHYLSQLTDPKVLSGMIGLLWCSKFERLMYIHIDNYKKGIFLDNKAVELISVSRILFGFLYQLTKFILKDNTEDDTESSTDVIISQNQTRKDLIFVANHFPVLNPTIVGTYFELLLLFEMCLQQSDGSTNMLAYFPNWLRSSIKKGLYKSAWQDQVPQQLQQKRVKILKDAVNVCIIKGSLPVMTPSVNSHVNFDTAPIIVDISEYQEFVFLLGRLWKITLSTIEIYWILNLFAVGLFDEGKKIFLEVEDKNILLQEVLSLLGHMIDVLVQHMEKSTKLAVLARTPPTLLEWCRKQGTSTAVKSCIKINSSQSCVSQVLSLILPYMPEGHKDKSVQLETMIKLIN